MALTKINSNLISNNTVANTNIADNAVDATKIASNSILTRHIDDAQITTDQILDGTIATADIADDAVTADKLANAINTSIAAKLPLAGGTMTGNTRLNDNVKHKYGSGDYFQIYHDGTNANITNGAGHLTIDLTIADKDFIVKGTDGSTDITALTLDMSAAGAATFNSSITFGDGHTIGNDGDDNLAITGSANENIIIDSADDIILDADGGDVIFRDGGVEKMRLDAGDLLVGTSTSVSASKLTVSGATMVLHDSSGSVLRFQKTLGTNTAFIANRSYAFHDGNGLAVATTDSNPIRFATNDTERMRLDASGNVGIGITSPDNLLTVKGAAHAGINIRAGDGYNATLAFSDASGAWYESFIRYRTDTNTMAFDVAGGEKMSITSAGKVLIGTAEAATVGKAIVMAMVFG